MSTQSSFKTFQTNMIEFPFMFLSFIVHKIRRTLGRFLELRMINVFVHKIAVGMPDN